MEFKRTSFDATSGYSKVIKAGPFVYVSGTTATQPDGIVAGIGDAYVQTKYVFDKIIASLEKAGSKKEEVVRVKIYATDVRLAGDIMKAFAEIFKDINPACTLVGISALNRPTQLIEIDADAIIGSAE